MKTLLTSLVFALTASLTLTAQDDHHIEVTGTATVYGEVDQISWQISIRGEGETIEAASDALSKATDGLASRINELEIPGESLRFSRMQSGRKYKQVENSQVADGYFVERGAVIKIDSLEPSHAVEVALLADDGIEINQLKLESSRYEMLKQEAVVQAVRAAREKAELMANELGTVLGPILMVKEGAVSSSGIIFTSNLMKSYGTPVGGDTRDFEKVELESTVTLRFALH